MKQVRYSLGAEDPYSHVDTILNNSFETVIVPTFTPAVLYTGVFDVSATESESGTFSQLFLKSAEGRTLSPFKSFALKGLMTPELLSLHTFNDYIAGGMFHFFNSNDVVSVNVGTMDIRFGTIHYLESMCNLPYIRHRDVRIRVIDSNGISRSSEYCHLDYKIRVKFSRDKIERDLHRAGIIKVLIINDMIVRIIPEIDCSDYLIKRLKADPYYLVD
ncbi:MAG: AAC(3) family N-acetyltransferase [Candidatus Cloacimonadaceae bacterium]|nr:AAC(3) family N-acetyltransferase [Candidatus Cloacimonadaceae bacterium]